MKRALIAVTLCAFILGVNAQEKPKDGFEFTTVKELAITPIKNQNRSSTCWSFSGLALLESELLRMGKGEYDLAEMFVVHHTMLDRAERYVRLHGEGSFSPGGSSEDVVYCLKHYGIVPQEAMEGIMYGDTLPIHSEIDAVAGGYVNAIAKGRHAKLTPVWKNGLTAIYDTYLGACPEKFTYKGKEYTPKSFAASLGLNADDYVSLASFTHHPFYTQFAVEVPDNWRNGLSWNLPIDELIAVIDNAIAKGYTLMWAADVSEVGFSRDGIAVAPNMENTELTGSDMARWTGLTPADKKKEATARPLPEREITQEIRQMAYDNWETTDDHGMLIYGIAKDQNGKEYYMVKNSWGTNNKYKGTWYASKAFTKYKTMNILLHKDAIPADVKKKLGIK
ncbi:aminopeptidase [Bacteroides sp. 214]|uniref:aminopeptidase C n=1 Tax=Bacteroides sp. 214 TaxID=2302935 RepID=UPI0013D69B8F|nr:C1 family peptidase [Bacteroides sp. 214]NDW13491.1 aminopeptidase [Bacteroides sp. 214]